MNRGKELQEILVIQKYKESKIGIISMIITLCVAVLCYMILLYLLQKGSLSNEMHTIISMFRDVLLAIVSIIATSLLTSVFIEKNKKNIDYTEMIANDIFASPEFYTNLTDENKKKIQKYLEESIYHKDAVKSELYQLCREKIFSDQSKYYYSDLNMSVSYFVYNSYSEKRVKRIMKIRSYNDKLNTEKLYLFSYNLSPTENKKNFEVIKAGIGVNNEILVIGKDIEVEKSVTKDELLDKCGYTEHYDVYLCKPIILKANEDTILNIEYVSRVLDEDNSVGFGVSVPCKKFYLNFMAPFNFIVYAHTYGFFNTENHFANSAYRNNMIICFDKWLLPGEGVTISVVESNETVVESILESPKARKIIEKDIVEAFI